ncbi:MAG: hypothetical protein ACXWIG_02675 [Caldimonas sp.]
MNYSTGKLTTILVLGVVLAAIAAWIIAARYRSALRRLMSAADPAGTSPGDGGVPRTPGSPPVAPLPGPTSGPTLAVNRRAGWRLTFFLVGVSLLVATTSAVLQLLDAVGASGFSSKRLAVIAAVAMWPMLPSLAIVWRWSRTRLFVAFVVFLVAAFALMLWRSIEPRPSEVLLYLLLDVGPGLVLIALLCLGTSTRAIAPWLLPPMIGLVWASIAGIDLLDYLVGRRVFWLGSLASVVGVPTVLAMFAAAPWLLAWWPMRALLRRLARAYSNRSISELALQFGAVWTVQMIWVALSAASEHGLAALGMLAPLLWIPLGFFALRQWGSVPARPPTLLVLRVFQHDAAVRALFDHVVERWRLTGNTVLIAGTDLVDQTLDAGDALTFLDGRLGERFVSRVADVEPRIAEFDFAPDLEGRFRINECYCRDSTWREAFAALAGRSDVVLMDLRGFQARNEGCRHELATLARAESVGRVVVLTDAATDRASADAAAAGAPAGRFAWLEVAAGGQVDSHRLLERLLAPATVPA